jgi:hypothetical protein
MNAREVAVALEKTGVITSRWDFERYLRQHESGHPFADGHLHL